MLNAHFVLLQLQFLFLVVLYIMEALSRDELFLFILIKSGWSFKKEKIRKCFYFYFCMTFVENTCLQSY